VDFDMVWGHRRNVEGYIEGAQYFDSRLPDLDKILLPDDIVIITADHGCDPLFKGTDHTRERVPIIMYGPNVKGGYIGERKTFADVGQTLAQYFGLKEFKSGTPFL
jgi:phosphopentomutase